MKCVCGYEDEDNFIKVELSNDITINQVYDSKHLLFACPKCYTVKLGAYHGYDLEGEV